MKVCLGLIGLALGCAPIAIADPVFPYRAGMTIAEVRAISPDWRWNDSENAPNQQAYYTLQDGPPIMIGGIEFTPRSLSFIDDHLSQALLYAEPLSVSPDECMARAGPFISELVRIFGPVDQAKSDSDADSMLDHDRNDTRLTHVGLHGRVQFTGGSAPIVAYSIPPDDAQIQGNRQLTERGMGGTDLDTWNNRIVRAVWSIGYADASSDESANHGRASCTMHVTIKPERDTR